MTNDLMACARAVTDGETILATIEIPAPPQRVFQALATKEAESWWGAPDVYCVTDWKADVRMGGEWSLVVKRTDNSIYPASGRFLEIKAPEKIVQTRRYDWDCPILGRRDTTVTYMLDGIAKGTRMTVRHDGFAGLKAGRRACSWLGAISRLAQRLPDT